METGPLTLPGKGSAVSLDQKRARWFGVLYLLTFITSIPALALYEPALRHPVAFVAGSGNVNKIYLGALLELLLILANIGTAIVIVPISHGPAFGKDAGAGNARGMRGSA